MRSPLAMLVLVPLLGAGEPPPPAPTAAPAPDAASALDLAAGLTVTVFPGRVLASPGALSDAFSLTITNNTTQHTPVNVKVEGLNGWQGTPARIDDVAPGGSVMLAMYIRAPGLAASPADNMLVTATAESDGKTRGQASFVAARRDCLVDWNGYGGLTNDDLQAFLSDILRRNADFDGDGATTGADLLTFVELFFVGCPAPV